MAHYQGQALAQKREEFKEIGLPMYPSGFHRLKRTDITAVRIPAYSKDFFWVMNVLRYIGFCQNLINANKEGPLIDRRLAEAAWLHILLVKYQDWDPNELTARYGLGNELKEKKRRLQHALEQVSYIDLSSPCGHNCLLQMANRFVAERRCCGDILGQGSREACWFGYSSKKIPLSWFTAYLLMCTFWQDLPDDSDIDHAPHPDGDHITDGDSDAMFGWGEYAESSGGESVGVIGDGAMDEKMGECADAMEQMEMDEDGDAPMDLD